MDSSGTANHSTFMLVLFNVCTDTNVGAAEGTVTKTGQPPIIIFSRILYELQLVKLSDEGVINCFLREKRGIFINTGFIANAKPVH